MASEGPAIRKRQQIANANRMMFLWVAGVSAVVGIAAVAAIFLVQRGLFNEKVLSEKNNTASVLEANNEAVSELQGQVRALNTDEDLKRAMVAGELQPVQVVLDALPADANSSAFGASLQKKLLNIDGVRLESLAVTPVDGVEVNNIDTDLETTSETDMKEIGFNFVVSTASNNADGLKKVLLSLERSIRPIDLTNVIVEAQGDRRSLTVTGRTFYEPAQTIDLKDKLVKP